MTYIDHSKINNAIRDCLQRCYKSSNAIPRIAEFLDALRSGGGWQDSELREVEARVRRILSSILDGATYPGDATDKPVTDALPDGSKSAKTNGA